MPEARAPLSAAWCDLERMGGLITYLRSKRGVRRKFTDDDSCKRQLQENWTVISPLYRGLNTYLRSKRGKKEVK